MAPIAVTDESVARVIPTNFVELYSRSRLRFDWMPPIVCMRSIDVGLYSLNIRLLGVIGQ